MKQAGVIAVLAVLMFVAQPVLAGGSGDAAVNRNGPYNEERDFGTLKDPNNIADRRDPWNDDCGAAEAWRGRAKDFTHGRVGGQDVRDWSGVKLYRTESLTPTITKGTATVAVGEYCGQEPNPGALLNVGATGAYYMRVQAGQGGAAYKLNYEITANDAGLTTDVSDEPASAHPVRVAATQTPQDHAFLSGSLPNRPDHGPDQDWFHIVPSLLDAPSCIDPGACAVPAFSTGPGLPKGVKLPESPEVEPPNPGSPTSPGSLPNYGNDIMSAAPNQPGQTYCTFNAQLAQNECQFECVQGMMIRMFSADYALENSNPGVSVNCGGVSDTCQLAPLPDATGQWRNCQKIVGPALQDGTGTCTAAEWNGPSSWGGCSVVYPHASASAPSGPSSTSCTFGGAYGWCLFTCMQGDTIQVTGTSPTGGWVDTYGWCGVEATCAGTGACTNVAGPAQTDHPEYSIWGFCYTWTPLNVGTCSARPPGPSGGPAVDSLSVGLLTASFVPDCDTDGQFELSLYETDGSTLITSLPAGCGLMKASCIALSFSPVSGVYAKTRVMDGAEGAGYDFTGDFFPLYVVNLEDPGIVLDTEQPWCNPIVPLQLSLTNPGDVIMDAEGRAIARIPEASNLG